MKRIFWLAVGLLVCCAAAASAAPLKADQAAFVGAWHAPAQAPVKRIRLALLVRQGDCVKTAGPEVEIDDHEQAGKSAMWKLHPAKPGLYGLISVSWGGGDNRNPVTWSGESRQRGSIWTVEAQPGVVTDVGVWSIGAPYPQRYTIDGASFDETHDLAASLAKDVAPLLVAHPVKARLTDQDGRCAASTN